jgi:Mn2+/Fe2+ NRAMP family transporter
VRTDLAVGYALTAVFGVAMLVLAAAALGGAGHGMPPGSAGLVACAEAIREAATTRFGEALGTFTSQVFLIGVWGAVFTSTLGVWQGVPYLFADYLRTLRGSTTTEVDPRSLPYRGYLFFLAIPPAILLFLDRPIWVIKVYTLTGGLFMPVLAGSLLWLNSRRSLVGEQRNGWVSTTVLVAALVLFLAIAMRQVLDLVG